MYLQKGIGCKTFFKLVFCWRLEDQWRKEQDPDPDPLIRSMDQEHWTLFNIFPIALWPYLVQSLFNLIYDLTLFNLFYDLHGAGGGERRLLCIVPQAVQHGGAQGHWPRGGWCLNSGVRGGALLTFGLVTMHTGLRSGCVLAAVPGYVKFRE